MLSQLVKMLEIDRVREGPKRAYATNVNLPRARALESRAVAVDAVRTPDELLEELPEFPFAPHYREVDGLRLAHLDEGEGRPVVFFHGEPTWSYLWRKVIPPLRDAGSRCIAPDYAGFGRSDKPTDIGWYSYDRHVALAGTLLEDLDLRDATAVVHDWGGPIGLRLAVEHPDRISRMVIMDTGLFTGEQRMSDAWHTFRNFVERTEDLPISLLVRNACARGMSDEVAAAYDAPFPRKESKAGARAFPLMLPITPEMPGAAAGKRALEALRGDHRPALILWADSDPVLPPKVGEAFAAAIGRDPPHEIRNASHFLQEDAGEEIGERIVAWLAAGS
jgi:haloalkane dehalogenase